LEVFGGMSFGLDVVFQSNIKVWQYYYVNKDPQAQQAPMHHVMMLRQQYIHLFITTKVGCSSLT